MSRISDDRLRSGSLISELLVQWQYFNTDGCFINLFPKDGEMLWGINDLSILIILEGTSGARSDSPTAISAACKPGSFRDSKKSP